jgi:hypothetical protein
MTKIAGSGSISQRHGSADSDPHQNAMDPQHWISEELLGCGCHKDPPELGGAMGPIGAVGHANVRSAPLQHQGQFLLVEWPAG